MEKANILSKLISKLKGFVSGYKKRYFICFYIGKNRSGTVQGQLTVHTDRGFPKRVDLVKVIQEHKVSDVVITNIIELSKRDNDYWVSSESGR